jgi:hypothetical protein
MDSACKLSTAAIPTRPLVSLRHTLPRCHIPRRTRSQRQRAVIEPLRRANAKTVDFLGHLVDRVCEQITEVFHHLRPIPIQGVCRIRAIVTIAVDKPSPIPLDIVNRTERVPCRLPEEPPSLVLEDQLVVEVVQHCLFRRRSSAHLSACRKSECQWGAGWEPGSPEYPCGNSDKPPPQRQYGSNRTPPRGR